MYQAISAIFVCQMFNVPRGIEHYVIMLVTAVLASVGTPGWPQAGIVMMSIVMGSVGVPPEIIAQGVGIILVVDWALDRARTALNVFGDSVGAAVIANTFAFKTAKPAGSARSAQAPRRDSERSGRSSRPERSSRSSSSSTRTRDGKRSEPRKDSRPERAERSERPERKERSTRRHKSSSPEETRAIFAGMVAVPTFDMSRVPEGAYKRREARPEPAASVEEREVITESSQAPHDYASAFKSEDDTAEIETAEIETAATVEVEEPVEIVESAELIEAPEEESPVVSEPEAEVTLAEETDEDSADVDDDDTDEDTDDEPKPDNKAMFGRGPRR
jgi:hypothetical protein